MFSRPRRLDIPSTALLSVLFFFSLLTVFQILMMHSTPLNSKAHDQRKLHMELRELDINLHSVMMQTVPSVELNRRLLQNQINSKRFLEILREASRQVDNKNNQTVLPLRNSVGDIEGNSVFHQTQRKMTDNENDFVSVSTGAEELRLSESLSTSEANKRSATSGQLLNPVSTKLSGAYSHIDSDPAHKTRAAGNAKVDVGIIHQHLATISSEKQDTSLAKADIQTKRQQSTERTHSLTSQNNKIHQGCQNHNHNISSTNKEQTRQKPDYSIRNDTTDPIKSNEMGIASKRKNSTDQSKGNSYGNISKAGVVSYCPAIPPNLQGNFHVNLTHAITLSQHDVLTSNPKLQSGGTGQPTQCTARHKVLVIIPYRDREKHLTALLNYLHPLMQRQQLQYRIAVVEQTGNLTFNKARIMNVAFVESLKRFRFTCAIFHDVDLVPEDDRNMYSCPRQPRHMSVGIDEMGYKLAYPELVGGVLNMRTEHFQRVNGYSNLYWGWGAEDDDMAYRIMQVGLQITRPPENVARYKMIKHTKRKPSDYRKRVKLLITGTRRYQFDGLNSLSYKLVHVKETPLYTHILVDVGKPPRGFR